MCLFSRVRPFFVDILRAKSCTSQLWLKVNCRLKVNCKKKKFRLTWHADSWFVLGFFKFTFSHNWLLHDVNQNICKRKHVLFCMCRCQRKYEEVISIFMALEGIILIPWYIKCIQFICASQNYYTHSISSRIAFGYANVIGNLCRKKCTCPVLSTILQDLF